MTNVFRAFSLSLSVVYVCWISRVIGCADAHDRGETYVYLYNKGAGDGAVT